MEARKLVYTLLTLSFLLPSISCAKNIREYNESELFHNFAYAACVGSAFESDEIKSDANRSASAYMQFSNISMDAYEAIRKKVNNWLSKNYMSKTGKSLQLMKCIDFVNSGEVQAVFNKFDPCKDKNSWLDEEEFNKKCK